MDSVTTKCNAKINLSIDVLKRRPDGYHDVELILNEISLHDTLTVTLNKTGVINLNCSDKTLPADAKNIAYRAAELFFSETGIEFGADIDLVKKIPHGAGLAGGSADAAGVLRALNKLTGSPLSADRLSALALKLGADVPFCLNGGCALAEGIGEILTPLPHLKNLIYVIVKPKESISTTYVYNNLDLSNRPKNLNIRAVADGIINGDTAAIARNSGNILESVTAKKYPVINEIKQALYDSGAILSMMSGSGTAVFGMFDELIQAHVAAEAMRKFSDEVYLV